MPNADLEVLDLEVLNLEMAIEGTGTPLTESRTSAPKHCRDDVGAP